MKKISIVILSVGMFFATAHYVFAQEVELSQEEVKSSQSFIQKNLTKVREFALVQYEQVDAWRLTQRDVWEAIKSEKELQITEEKLVLNENRENRTDRVLNGEQVSIVNASGQDFEKTGNVFLMKLYTALLTIFVIIFSSPIIFYGIILFFVLVFLNKLFVKLFRRQQF